MQYIHTLLYFITTDRTFLAARFRFSPLSTSLHYYNINISLRKYFPRILFLSHWYERVVTEHVTDGNIFSRKKGAIARHRAAKETKPVPLSPEWFDCVEKRKIRAIRRFPSSSFFNRRQVDDALSRERRVSQHLSSSNRDLWDAHSSEKGAIFVTRRDIAFYVHLHTTRFRFVVLLFRRFMQSRRMVWNRRWFWNRCYSLLKRRICIYDNEIVCTLFCIECGKCGFYFCISRLLLAESWRMIRVYFPQSEIYLSSFLSCKIIKID